MTTTNQNAFVELDATDLRSIRGGEDVTSQVAGFARRAAEDRVTTSCIERFGTKDGSQTQIRDCIVGAGDQAFQSTLKRLGGVPVSR